MKQQTTKKLVYCRILSISAFFLFSACACEKNKQIKEIDTVTDVDIIVQADQTDDTLSDDEEFVEMDNAQSDKDVIGGSCLADPEGIEYITNTHTGNEECPDLSQVAFPYYDTDSKIHFCRKCDKVWKSDPQCVRNLWKEQNCALCTAMPDYDCCGYPCTMGKLTPFYKDEREGYYLDECDMMLNPNNPKGWQMAIRTFKHFNLSLGKVGFVMSHVDSAWQNYPQVWTKNFEFDLNTRKYSAMDPGIDVLTYYKGAKLSNVKSGRDDKMEYLLYSNNSSWQVAYPKKIRQTVYNPVINETWAFANIKESDALSTKMMYAKIGEWKWIGLGDGVANEPSIVNNRLVFHANNFKGYICDLDKKPLSLDECRVVNREGEGALNLVLDSTNEDILYYADAYKTRDSLLRVDLSKTPIQYEYLKMEELIDPLMSVYPVSAKGVLLIYNNNFYTNTEKDDWDIRACFFRLDLKKSYCSLPTPHKDGVLEYRQSYTEFENHWVVWQDSSAPYMKARDMECYCDRHPELCPFDDYTPQPDNPKDVKAGTRPNGEKR